MVLPIGAKRKLRSNLQEVTLKSLDPLTDSKGHIVGSLGIAQDPMHAVAWSGITEGRRCEDPGSWE